MFATVDRYDARWVYDKTKSMPYLFKSDIARTYNKTVKKSRREANLYLLNISEKMKALKVQLKINASDIDIVEKSKDWADISLQLISAMSRESYQYAYERMRSILNNLNIDMPRLMDKKMVIQITYMI